MAPAEPKNYWKNQTVNINVSRGKVKKRTKDGSILGLKSDSVAFDCGVVCVAGKFEIAMLVISGGRVLSVGLGSETTKILCKLCAL